jgi:hypothetical protein
MNTTDLTLSGQLNKESLRIISPICGVAAQILLNYLIPFFSSEVSESNNPTFAMIIIYIYMMPKQIGIDLMGLFFT